MKRAFTTRKPHFRCLVALAHDLDAVELGG